MKNATTDTYTSRKEKKNYPLLTQMIKSRYYTVNVKLFCGCFS